MNLDPFVNRLLPGTEDYSSLYIWAIFYVMLPLLTVATLLPYRFLNILHVALHVEILISCVFIVTKF